jgi:hypothetical protein
MRAADFIKTLPRRFEATGEQAANRKGIVEIGRDFDMACGLKSHAKAEHCQEAVLLESGHQPNFFPHSGVWRKIFLLDRFTKMLEAEGCNALPVFGFADYNISTAQLLCQSRLPDTNREGYRNIGFKVKEADRFRRFDCVEKPDEAKLKKQLLEIASMYELNSKKARIPYERIARNVDRLSEVILDAHRRASSYADFNAFVIAKVCTELLDLKVIFFRYSDVQRKSIFLHETERLAAKTGEYNKACNEAVKRRGLQDELGQAEDSFFPLWLHCGCGGKVTLSLSDGMCQGRCPVCDSSHRITMGNIREHYPDLAPTAMARNIIFSEGLGTILFISGSGGGLKYGRIANDVSDAEGFQKPLTLAWKAHDRYLGVSHASAVSDLAISLGTRIEDLDRGDINAVIEARRRTLQAALDETPKSDKRSVQRIHGHLKSLDTQSRIASNVFKVVPSAFDVFANAGFDVTLGSWDAALEHAQVDAGEFIIITGDLEYGQDVSAVFRAMEGLL